MAKDQRNVEAITPMEVDFAKWYTDICLKAELVDYASVKGFMILRPYGYAIWENIQRIMDGMFKKTGHVNVAMPVLIPESLLKKEGELVEGFAPEVAWVTMGGSEKLEERLAQRDSKIDALYIELRQVQGEKLELIYEKHALELRLKEASVRRCDVRGCARRKPPTDF